MHQGTCLTLALFMAQGYGSRPVSATSVVRAYIKWAAIKKSNNNNLHVNEITVFISIYCQIA
jgi:hypothetical protein